MPKRLVDLVLPVAVIGAFILFYAVPYVRTAEQQVFDVLLRARPLVPEHPEILLINVDDAAVGQVGHWPWNRTYLARAFMLLRELESGPVVFDIEYVDDADGVSDLGQAARFHGGGYFRVRLAGAPPVELSEPPDPTEPPEPPRPDRNADRDGVRRRTDFVAGLGDTSSGQLVVPPLLDWIGRPAATVLEDAVVLEGARMPGTNGDRTIRIPLTADRRVLINWPRPVYEASFRHMTYGRLIQDWVSEDSIVAALRTMRRRNVLGLFDEADEILSQYEVALDLQRSILEGGDRNRIDEWRELRAGFFAELGELLVSDARDRLIAGVQEAIADGLDAATELELRYVRQEARRLYADLDRIYTDFLEHRAVLMEEIPGSFIIVGHVASGAIETSVTPFHDDYPNAGVSAALVNTILQQEFLVDQPWWVTLALLVVVATLVTIVVRNLDPVPTLLVGLGTLVLVIGGGVLLFLFTGIYVDMVALGGGIVVTVIVLSAINPGEARRRGLEIRSAFEHAMPEAVLRQIARDPSQLALDGLRKDVTVLYVDVHDFSSVSESLAPNELTALLDGYLGAMSEIVIDEGGMIERHNADEIVALWNVPLDSPGHPIRACRAAIRMRRKEIELNKEYTNAGIAPKPIRTRIGIHTGQMVVGNLGTASRMAYTATGPHMNAAARLGRVNRQYGTDILISEQTYLGTRDGSDGTPIFSARRLDRVRIPGIGKPIRIYELIESHGLVHGDKATVAKLSAFDAGLAAFEAKDWATAGRHFREIMRQCPNDGPARCYAGRVLRFVRTPPAADWDGVYSLGRV